MTMAVLGVVALLAAALLGYGIALYNQLVFLKNQAERAWYNIDVLLKQRHDEIPKLVAVCEGSAKFERDTLDRVVTARAAAASAGSVKARAAAEDALSAALGGLFAVAEAYPEIKSVQLFGQLQARVSSLESEIADRREFYNDAATNYNTALETVPTNFVAGWGGFRARELFLVAPADKADAGITFSL